MTITVRNMTGRGAPRCSRQRWRRAARVAAVARGDARWYRL